MRFESATKVTPVKVNSPDRRGFPIQSNQWWWCDYAQCTIFDTESYLTTFRREFSKKVQL